VFTCVALIGPVRCTRLTAEAFVSMPAGENVSGYAHLVFTCVAPIGPV